MSDTPLPEPLESFLQAPPSLAPEAKVQEGLLQQTRAMLVQPRSRASWPLAVAIAASIVVIIASIFLARQPPRDPTPPRNDFVERDIAPPPNNGPKPKQPAPKSVAPVPANPRDLEWKAFDADNDALRARLYFQAGDLYLAQLDDYESAVRCYGQALDYCAAADLTVNPDDNWLVMALKRDRRKEN
jgi:hypothetical protein